MATLFANDNNLSQQKKAIDTIFDLVWGEGAILEDPDLIKEEMLKKNIPASVIDNSFERGSKLELKQNIKEALDSEIFGVPSFKVDDEFFWGHDSLPLLAQYLAGNDNWNKELYNKLLD